ncbi:hypothetical protein HAX54_005056, partial [Datura stramonium]|nr:hypothetical protein [Datura stramonium]
MGCNEEAMCHTNRHGQRMRWRNASALQRMRWRDASALRHAHWRDMQALAQCREAIQADISSQELGILLLPKESSI